MVKAVKTIGNPVSWSAKTVGNIFGHFRSVTEALTEKEVSVHPEIMSLSMTDIRAALKQGFADFVAFRTDVVFLCLLYPLVGLSLVWMATQGDLLHLLFPVIAGFALVGPVAAVGLYEMSRRREQGEETNWMAALKVLESPRFGAVFVLGLFHVVVFALWLLVANLIFVTTLGPAMPETIREFVRLVFTTRAGWEMAAMGMITGFFFAAAVLAFSITSFPMLLDREVGLKTALTTSVQVARKNPLITATWGLIVATGLALGSLPVLLGLIIVVPVLGHATWHLYRRAVSWK